MSAAGKLYKPGGSRQPPGLGRSVGERPGVVSVPLREIRANLSNPRKRIDEAELTELAESIRQHGLLQPILVRPLTMDERRQTGRRYQIVIGSRRFYAAERAGLTKIDCYVRGLSSDEAVLASFLDHAHHRTLTPAEESEFLRYLRDRRKLRLREIAALLNKSIAYVSRRLGVSEDEELDRAVQAGRIGQAAAQEILRAPEPWWPTLVAQAEGLTADQVRALVKEIGDVDASAGGLARVGAIRSNVATSLERGLDTDHRALRRNSPVTRIPPSPAIALLRQLHDWSATVPADWQPSPPDVELLNEAVALIHGAAGRASSGPP